jgi:hypothetical protein
VPEQSIGMIMHESFDLGCPLPEGILGNCFEESAPGTGHAKYAEAEEIAMTYWKRLLIWGKALYMLS